MADATPASDDAEDEESGFAGFGFVEPIQRALNAAGYATPTPIQEGAIPALMQRRDMLGIAQTGTGKTAAFALPILNAIALNPQKLTPKHTRALILAPTRELVVQIADNIRNYGKHMRLRSCAVFGGVSEHHQIKAMGLGVDVLIATPGRLLDLAERNHIKLGQVQTFVLDEADRMLDMGFIRDVNKISAMLPAQRQSLLFSATMPKEIAHLADKLLNDPVRVEVTPEVITVERIAQKIFFVEGNQKRPFLVSLLSDPSMTRVVVFTRTKHVANRVTDHLNKAGITADAIHGNKSQNARQKALDSFKKGHVRVLVATDIAARGIHVSDISHVVNYELPNVPEIYVHRIGRTARAGADGIAYSLCDKSERGYLKDIERFTKRPIPVGTHAFTAMASPSTDAGQHEERSDRRDGRQGGRGGRGFGGGGRDRHRAAERKHTEQKHGDRHHSDRNEHRGDRKDHRGPRDESRGSRFEKHGERPEGRGARKDFRPRGDHRNDGRSPEARLQDSRHHQFNERHDGRSDRARHHDADQPVSRAQADRSHAERHFGNAKHEERLRDLHQQGEGSGRVREHDGRRDHKKHGSHGGPKRNGGKPGGGKPHGRHHGQHGKGGPRHDAGGERPMRRPR